MAKPQKRKKKRKKEKNPLGRLEAAPLEKMSVQRLHPILDMIRKCDLRSLEEVLGRPDTNVEARFPVGPNMLTPLGFAVLDRNAEALRLLLRCGASLATSVLIKGEVLMPLAIAENLVNGEHVLAVLNEFVERLPPGSVGKRGSVILHGSPGRGGLVSPGRGSGGGSGGSVSPVNSNTSPTQQSAADLSVSAGGETFRDRVARMRRESPGLSRKSNSATSLLDRSSSSVGGGGVMDRSVSVGDEAAARVRELSRQLEAALARVAELEKREKEREKSEARKANASPQEESLEAERKKTAVLEKELDETLALAERQEQRIRVLEERTHELEKALQTIMSLKK